MIIQVDLTSQTPLYQQIRDQIVVGIANGDLAHGELLPTVRQLADDLGINPMTVNKAYTLLKQEGMIVSDRRQGTRVKAEEKKQKLPLEYWDRMHILLAEGMSKTKNAKFLMDKIQEQMDTLDGGKKS